MVVIVNSVDDGSGEDLRIVSCLPCWLFYEPLIERCVVDCESRSICVAYVVEVCDLCKCGDRLVV